MIRIRNLIVLLFALAASSAGAQVFYEIESPQGRQSWLLGTVHSEDSRVLEFPPVLQQALRDAEVLALELVPDADMLGRLNRAMNLPSDQGLDEIIGEQLYARVVELLDDYGMGEPAVRRLRPWAAALTLSAPPPETGMFMDLVLAMRGGLRDAEVVGLETLDEQLDFVTGLGTEAHIEMLRRAVADYERGRELFEEIIEAYVAGDIETLRRLAEAELEAMGPDVRRQFREQGIVRRNRNMLERALPRLEQGGVLIAVGTLHLPGEAGLVELLRAEGYTVEPIY